MIVSVHIPKTAGTSFQTILASSNNSICLNYEQKPLLCRTQNNEIKDIIVAKDCDVIHGHFIASSLKGIDSSNFKYIVWLRDPVERVISHYNHWQRTPDLTQPISKAIYDGELTLKDFSKIEAMCDVQSFFLGTLSLEDFTFVGIQEKFTKSIEIFNTTFNLNLDSNVYLNYNSNMNKKKYKEFIGNDLYTFIENNNKIDKDLYMHALTLMENNEK